MEELQNTLALLVASLTKSASGSTSSKPKQDIFQYGAFGEVVAIIDTKLQMNPSPKMPTISSHSSI